jgi:hypothetical protein
MYLVQHTAVPHHPALGMNVLAAALAFHLDNPLHLWGNGQLPAQFSGEILGAKVLVNRRYVYAETAVADTSYNSVSDAFVLEGR